MFKQPKNDAMSIRESLFLILSKWPSRSWSSSPCPATRTVTGFLRRQRATVSTAGALVSFLSLIRRNWGGSTDETAILRNFHSRYRIGWVLGVFASRLLSHGGLGQNQYEPLLRFDHVNSHFFHRQIVSCLLWWQVRKAAAPRWHQASCPPHNLTQVDYLLRSLWSTDCGITVLAKFNHFYRSLMPQSRQTVHWSATEVSGELSWSSSGHVARRLVRIAPR